MQQNSPFVDGLLIDAFMPEQLNQKELFWIKIQLYVFLEHIVGAIECVTAFRRTHYGFITPCRIIGHHYARENYPKSKSFFGVHVGLMTQTFETLD